MENKKEKKIVRGTYLEYAYPGLRSIDLANLRLIAKNESLRNLFIQNDLVRILGSKKMVIGYFLWQTFPTLWVGCG